MNAQETNEIIRKAISELQSKFQLKDDETAYIDTIEEKDNSVGYENKKANRYQEKGWLMRIMGLSHKANKGNYIINPFLQNRATILNSAVDDLKNSFELAKQTEVLEYLKLRLNLDGEIAISEMNSLGLDVQLDDLNFTKNEKLGKRGTFLLTLSIKCLYKTCNCPFFNQSLEDLPIDDQPFCEKQNFCYLIVKNFFRPFENLIDLDTFTSLHELPDVEKCGVMIKWREKVN